MKRLFVGALAALALGAGTTGAGATTVFYDFKGTISSGNDGLSLFGISPDLASQPYELLISVDFSKGFSSLSVPFTYNLGGDDDPAFPRDESPVGAVIFIKGGEYTLPDLRAEISYFGASSPLIGLNFGSDSYAFTLFSDDISGDSVQLAYGASPVGNPGYLAIDLAAGDTYIDFGSPALPTVTTVPEPDTWSMFILGLFSLGGLLRANRGRICQRRQLLIDRPKVD